MRPALAAAAFLVCAPTALTAGPFDLPADAVGLISEACVTTSLDWPALFANAQALATNAQLPQVMSTDEAAMFGNPGGAHVIFSKTIDSMACRLVLPAQTGTEQFYQDLVTGMDWKIGAVYPDALSVEQNKPSPHEAEHQWVFRVAAERHFAVSLDWERESGVSVNIGYSQVYD
ncbi:MAG: hypothetical protein AAF231_04690 [Pseudomonadota bacterium]